MLMVVENDNVHMTELPFVAHNITDGLVEEEATAIEEIGTFTINQRPNITATI